MKRGKQLEHLQWEIDESPGTVFYVMLEPAGLWDVGSWFQDLPDDITADTTDDELYQLAVKYEDEARASYTVILRGGVEAVYRYFLQVRDELEN